MSWKIRMVGDGPEPYTSHELGDLLNKLESGANNCTGVVGVYLK